MIKLNNISYNYPFKDELAIKNINCEIRKGEAVLFTGGSGCGKSTLMRIINGLIPHFFQGSLKGTVEINDIDNSTRNIPSIAKNIGTLFQDPEQQFFTLDIESELAFGHEQRGVPADKIQKIISEISEKLRVTHILKSSIFETSEGEKQKVALGTILSMTPEIVLLDEPTANLDYQATIDLAEMILKLKNEGMTVIIVDHRLYWLEKIIDTVYILEHGEIAKSGKISLLEDKSLLKTYGLRGLNVSSILQEISEIPEVVPNAKSVKIENLTYGYKNKDEIFIDRSFEFPKGKVTAITGNNGCGKTTLARILTGLNKITEGQITIDNEKVSTKELVKRAGLVFQNSDHQLFMSSVEKELFTSGRHLEKKERTEKANDLLDHLNLAQFAKAHPQSLSGGQKQRLVIACALMKSPDILILDEPTSGLDGKNMEIISHILRKSADNGAAVIVITHDLELITAIADYNLNLTKEEKK